MDLKEWLSFGKDMKKEDESKEKAIDEFVKADDRRDESYGYSVAI
jgi:hypothetical protein